MLYFQLLSFFAGVTIALQANINSQLTIYLLSSLLATFVALFSSLIFIGITINFYIKDIISVEIIKSVPLYLWFSGGLFGAFALASFYFVIPKIGILSMISFSLAGQLVYSLISSHYGWFNMPVATISITKVVGVIFMLSGIFLINRG